MDAAATHTRRRTSKAPAPAADNGDGSRRAGFARGCRARDPAHARRQSADRPAPQDVLASGRDPAGRAGATAEGDHRPIRALRRRMRAHRVRTLDAGRRGRRPPLHRRRVGGERRVPPRAAVLRRAVRSARPMRRRRQARRDDRRARALRHVALRGRHRPDEFPRQQPGGAAQARRLQGDERAARARELRRGSERRHVAAATGRRAAPSRSARTSRRRRALWFSATRSSSSSNTRRRPPTCTRARCSSSRQQINKFYVFDLSPANSLVPLGARERHARRSSSAGATRRATLRAVRHRRLRRGCSSRRSMRCARSAGRPTSTSSARARAASRCRRCSATSPPAASGRSIPRRSRSAFSTLPAMRDSTAGLFTTPATIAAAKSASRKRGVPRRRRAGTRVRLDAAERSRLELPRQQLPARQRAAGARHPVLEQRHHAAAGAAARGLPRSHRERTRFRARASFASATARSTFADVGIDTYVVGGLTDHITTWQGVYRTAQLYGGRRSTFVLANGGHVQSLINPPGNKRSWFVTAPARAATAEGWLARQAEERKDRGGRTGVRGCRRARASAALRRAALGSERHPPLSRGARHLRSRAVDRDAILAASAACDARVVLRVEHSRDRRAPHPLRGARGRSRASAASVSQRPRRQHRVGGAVRRRAVRARPSSRSTCPASAGRRRRRRRIGPRASRASRPRCSITSASTRRTCWACRGAERSRSSSRSSIRPRCRRLILAATATGALMVPGPAVGAGRTA